MTGSPTSATAELPYQRLIRLGLICSVFILASACSSSWSEGDVNETMLRGNKICRALNQYLITNGKLPSDLKELTPYYFAEVPLPTVGLKRWEYTPFGGSNYTLEVAVQRGTDPTLRTAREDGWRYDTH